MMRSRDPRQRERTWLEARFNTEGAENAERAEKDLVRYAQAESSSVISAPSVLNLACLPPGQA